MILVWTFVVFVYCGGVVLRAACIGRDHHGISYDVTFVLVV